MYIYNHTININEHTLSGVLYPTFSDESRLAYMYDCMMMFETCIIVDNIYDNIRGSWSHVLQNTIGEEGELKSKANAHKLNCDQCPLEKYRATSYCTMSCSYLVLTCVHTSLVCTVVTAYLANEELLFL